MEDAIYNLEFCTRAVPQPEENMLFCLRSGESIAEQDGPCPSTHEQLRYQFDSAERLKQATFPNGDRI
jgi:hypothetical protein